MKARWHRLLCWLGFHRWERSPHAKTPEEIGSLIDKATDGWQVMGLVLAAKRLCNLMTCTRCGREN